MYFFLIVTYCISNKYLLTIFNGLILDKDECLMENGHCEQVCVNDDPGYHCECFEGYRLIGVTCVGEDSSAK